jgi:uncharacterized membrane protein
MRTSRLEAFSDGIFSIAATLLVLELRVPQPDDQGLVAGLLRQWPSYAVYAVSFLTIGIMWVNHHALFSLVRSADRPLLFLNLVLLLTVAIVPFPTAVLGQYLGSSDTDSHAAAALYGLVMLLNALGWAATWTYVARHAPILVEHVSLPGPRSILRFLAGLVFYAMGTAVAFVSAPLSLLIYALVAVYYVLPNLPRSGRDL